MEYRKIEKLNVSPSLLGFGCMRFPYSSKNGCTGCRYCMPCPSGVDIPGIFKNWNESAVYAGTGADDKHHWHRTDDIGGGADKCVGCGKCEEICPQGLSIREDLKKAAEELK